MRLFFIVSALTAALGALALVIAAGHPSWIDSNGFLHEPFAWMASGRILLSFSVIFLLAASALWLMRTLGRTPSR